ncbi:MAG: hypothetical protein F4010_01225 [Cenarchaeum sp. SB0669_bin_11]|nr:hypothetical protein [Cenarchaeum sp. SB0669_bin_11]
MNRATLILKNKTGMFSRNTTTFGDINISQPADRTATASSLPHGTPVARHYLFRKKAEIGTVVGPVTARLNSTVHAEQVQQINDILERMNEHNFLAPLEED